MSATWDGPTRRKRPCRFCPYATRNEDQVCDFCRPDAQEAAALRDFDLSERYKR